MKNITQYKLNDSVLQVCNSIKNICDPLEIQAYIVGGFTRDLIIGRENKDVDIVVVDPQKRFENLGNHITKLVCEDLKIDKLTLFENFGTSNFWYDDLEFEIIGARKESYRRESRKPLVEDGTFQDDADRRDFTINCIYISLNENTFGDIIDPYNGINDMLNKVIRTPIDPEKTFFDDPLRIMRAIRFACQLNFTIHPDTFDCMKKNYYRINETNSYIDENNKTITEQVVSKERIVTEIEKIFKTKNSSLGIKLLNDCGVLDLIFPEVTLLKGSECIEENGIKSKHKDNFNHVLQVLKNMDELSSEIIEKLEGGIVGLKWIGLLHDIGKVKTKFFDPEFGWTFHDHHLESVKMIDVIFKRLKMPLNTELLTYVKLITSLHEPLKNLGEDSDESFTLKKSYNENYERKYVSDSARRRIIFKTKYIRSLNLKDIEISFLYDLIIFGICDTSSENDYKRRIFKSAYLDLYNECLELIEREKLSNFKLCIDGDQIMKIFNLTPSKTVGILKNVLMEAVLEGTIVNEYNVCLNFLTEFYNTLNIK